MLPISKMIAPLFLLLTGCFTVVNAQEAPPTTLRIDPANAMGGAASEMMDEISFTILESTSASEFGRIDQLEVTDQYYIILDVTTKQILIFDKAGKLHAKISSLKAGYQPSDYLSFFAYDRVNRLIEITGFDKMVYYFNTEGQQVKKSKVRFWGRSAYINKDQQVFYTYSADSRAKDSTAYEIMILKNDSILKKYLPYNQKHAPVKDNDMLSGNHSELCPDTDTSLLFVHSFDYNIYRIGATTLSPVYKFLFPQDASLPIDFTTNPAFNGKRLAFLKENKNKVYIISNPIRIGSNLFFKLQTSSSFNSYIYNLTSKTLYIANKLSPDERSYFLPVTDDTVGGMEFDNYSFLTSDSNYIYTSYASISLFRGKEAAEGKKIVYPEPLATYLKDAHNKKGNPVIVKMKFKAAL